MDVEAVRKDIVTHVYHLDSKKKVPLHQHAKLDELFYCIKGSGYGVLEDREVELEVGDAFIVHAGTMHALKTDEELYVTATLVPVVDDARHAD